MKQWPLSREIHSLQPVACSQAWTTIRRQVSDNPLLTFKIQKFLEEEHELVS